MSAESDHADFLMQPPRPRAARRAMSVRLAGVRSRVLAVVAARDTQIAVILLAEWAALATMAHASTAWGWMTAAEASALALLAIMVPLRLQVVRPLERQLEAAEGRVRAYETGAAEREMMMAILEESEGRMRAIFNNSPNGVVVLSSETMEPIDFNDTLPRLLGYSRAEFAHLPWDRYIIDDQAGTARGRLDCAARGSSELFTCACRTRTGGTFDASFSAQPVAVNGQPAVSCIVRDISQERAAQRELHLNHDKMQAMISELERRNVERAILTEMGSVLQACISLDEAFAAVSRFAHRLFPGAGGALYVYNHSRSDLTLAAAWNAPQNGFDDSVAPTDCWSLRQGRAYDRTDPSNLTCHHVGHDDQASYLCLPLTAQGETLGLMHLRSSEAPGGACRLSVSRQLVTVLSDQVTLAIANLRLRETLRHQSIHDPLTGLYNRRQMQESLRREVPRAQRSGRPLAVVMADLDHFKSFNDTFGHEAGDLVLTELGLLLKRSVRAGDLACRFGGEEFALVMPDTTLDGTVARMEGLRARVADLQLQHRGRPLGALTVSMGIALLPEHGTTPEDLLHAADQALYRAKQAGRNQVHIADPVAAACFG